MEHQRILITTVYTTVTISQVSHSCLSFWDIESVVYNEDTVIGQIRIVTPANQATANLLFSSLWCHCWRCLPQPRSNHDGNGRKNQGVVTQRLLRSLGTCSFYYTVMLACGCRKNGCLESPSLGFLDGHKQLKRILLLARLPGKSFSACRPHIFFPVPDPDLEIRGVGGGGLVI